MKQKGAVRSLVTGACGFIGSHMVEEAAAAGHEVIAADHPSAWAKDSVAEAKYPGLVRGLAKECLTIDLAKPETLATLPADVDYVFHVASLFSYAATFEALHKVNVEGTRALAARFAGQPRLVRWVQWGAGGVYGLPSKREVAVFTEETAPEPMNDYLRTKWQQEFAIMELGRTGKLSYTILRPTTVYGPRGGYGSRQLIMGVKDAPVVAIPRNMTGHIPFVHVKDVVRAALHLAACPAGANEVFNLNDDTDMTTVEYMQAMARLFNKPFVLLPAVPVKEITTALAPALRLQLRVARDLLRVKPAVEPDMVEYATEDFRYSNEKLKRTGYRFCYPEAREAFAETLRWYEENQ